MPSPEDLSTDDLRRLLAERENREQETYSMGRAVQAKNAAAGTPVLTPTSARQWKKNSGETDLELPSGNVCRVKRPGLPALLGRGVLPETLTPIISDMIEVKPEQQAEAESAQAKKLQEVMKGPDGFATMIDAACRVAAETVVSPQVLYHRRECDEQPKNGPTAWEDIPDNERNPDILYTDEIDLEDTMFLFQFVVGGSRSLQKFR